MAAARPFTLAVNRLKRSAKSWLTPADAPAITMLTEMAKALDAGELSPAMLGQFGLCYRNLLKRQPTDDGPADELESLLSEDRV